MPSESLGGGAPAVLTAERVKGWRRYPLALDSARTATRIELLCTDWLALRAEVTALRTENNDLARENIRLAGEAMLRDQTVTALRAELKTTAKDYVDACEAVTALRAERDALKKAFIRVERSNSGGTEEWHSKARQP